ncbi:MAG: rhodanese-like domain-containing protein [Proteobacteria bacterium]|nr:rhodanese-like domain-containing protein [Pseudomonadota bacterium]
MASKVQVISHSEVIHLQQESGAISVIDVREVDEFQDVRSPLAINFPLSRFDPVKLAERYPRQQTIYVLCRSGRRSLQAAEILVANGFQSVFNVEGGMLEWEASGLPVARGR